MRRFPILLALLLILVACRPQARFQPPENPSLPSATPVIPSPTPPAPTHTSAPSPSPVPSQTPIPTPAPSLTPSTPPVTILLFTGVIVPARCVQAAIDARGDPNYIYDEVRDVIQGADLAVGTLNTTLSDITTHTGCVPTYMLVSSAYNADAMADAGFDVMSVATNHIKNCNAKSCGDRAFFDTLDNLRRVGILPVGAGNNHAEAMQTVVVTVNGIRFGFVSLGQIEQTTYATEDTPGIAVLNKDNLVAAIAAARQVSDVVIAMPHWGPEDMAVPNWIQRNLARTAVEAGADVVVGNHTHVVQAIQNIQGIDVFYGLGNFVFDQGLRDHRQGVILLLRFEGRRYAGYELIPTHVDGDGTVHIAAPEEAQEVLQRIQDASRGLR